MVEARDALGESCLWCPVTRRVWWIDIRKPSLQCFDPVTQEHQTYPLPGPHCGCAALRRSGGLVVALLGWYLDRRWNTTPRCSSGSAGKVLPSSRISPRVAFS